MIPQLLQLTAHAHCASESTLVLEKEVSPLSFSSKYVSPSILGLLEKAVGTAFRWSSDAAAGTAREGQVLSRPARRPQGLARKAPLPYMAEPTTIWLAV